MNHVHQQMTVVKSNHLNEASYKLSLDERRLVISCIAKLRSKEEMPDNVTVTAYDYADMWGISTQNAYDQLRSATDNLYEETIYINSEKEKKRGRFRWVDGVVYNDGEGSVTVSFSKRVEPYLTRLEKHFTSYHLTEVSNFKSGHTIRLYELLMQFKRTGWKEATLEQWKDYFGVTDKYSRWVDFKKWVISPAVEEINRISNYSVTYDPLKSGRKIDRIKFKFEPTRQADIFN